MKIKYQFPSTDGINTIAAVKWLPEGEPRGILQITHGMIEYMDRYDLFAEHMTDQGFALFGYDQLGHGDSVKTKEDWGYIGKHPEKLLIYDMQKQREIAEKEYPNKPYFMLGHSMGSYELRKYIAEFGVGLAGAIIMGTGYEPVTATNVGKALVKTMEKIRGERHISKMVEGMAFGNLVKKWDFTGEIPTNNWLTKDPEIVVGYYNEPKTTFKFTLNGYKALFRLVNYDCRKENVDRIPKELPCLLISGALDPIGAEGKGVRKVYEMFKSAGIQDVSLKLFEDDRHEILNETNKEEVYQFVGKWIEDRI